MTKSYTKSPLNYIGGKYKLLPQLFEIFPEEVDTFVDLFAGGCNVGINSGATKIVCNDENEHIIKLYQYFQETATDEILQQIENRISTFDLNFTNTDGYLKLREQYNKRKEPLDFFVLICFSFNHQIRFNKKNEFNIPFGKNKSAYNDTIQTNLIRFLKGIKNKQMVFQSGDFSDLDITTLTKNDLVYCDPPYLISTAAYSNANGSWNKEKELKLLKFLDRLNQAGIRFALSNVIIHKGMTNDLLIEWSEKYNIHYLDKNYSNCNYRLKNKQTKTMEVLITNY